MKRRRRTVEEIEEICARFRGLKMTQREFAEEVGVSVGSLQNWLRQTPQVPGAEVARFVEVTPRPVVSPSKFWRIELPCGVVLVCGDLPETGYVAQLIRELQTP